LYTFGAFVTCAVTVFSYLYFVCLVAIGKIVILKLASCKNCNLIQCLKRF